jgi:hypothetical protein
LARRRIEVSQEQLAFPAGMMQMLELFLTQLTGKSAARRIDAGGKGSDSYQIEQLIEAVLCQDLAAPVDEHRQPDPRLPYKPFQRDGEGILNLCQVNAIHLCRFPSPQQIFRCPANCKPCLACVGPPFHHSHESQVSATCDHDAALLGIELNETAVLLAIAGSATSASVKRGGERGHRRTVHADVNACIHDQTVAHRDNQGTPDARHPHHVGQ